MEGDVFTKDVAYNDNYYRVTVYARVSPAYALLYGLSIAGLTITLAVALLGTLTKASQIK